MKKKQTDIIQEDRMQFGIVYFEPSGIKQAWFNSKSTMQDMADFLDTQGVPFKYLVDKRV